MSIVRAILIFSLFFSLSFAINTEKNTPLNSKVSVKKEDNATKKSVDSEKEREDAIAKAARLNKINSYLKQLKELDKELENNIWLKNYNNYVAYQETVKNITSLEQKLKHLDYLLKSSRVSKKRKKEYAQKKVFLEKELKALNTKKELLKDFQQSPFKEVLKPEDIPKEPVVTNPFMIFSAFSYIKQVKHRKNDYEKKLIELKDTIDKLEEKRFILSRLYSLTDNKRFLKEKEDVLKELNEFKTSYEIAKTTFKIYGKKIDDIILKLSLEIEEQIKRTVRVALFIFAVIIISLIFKLLAKKYISDNQRFYMANKIINFTNFSFIAIILLFSFIEDVSYLITVIGFASAGLAIAMKDLFMSTLGWLVIVIGGSFRVGDRIKVKKDGLVYVGDIIDISLLRMTILEDITLTSYMVNRRSGRVIFVPNNYIFTNLIANYSHEKLKTVWDGIDVAITFDSNHKKAVYLIKNIVKKYSKGYTEIARKQLNKLRNQYSLKNTNVEPRIYTFIEPHGIVISSWYMTNSFAALTLRSSISAEIIDAINKEDDIKIAYPTQTINLKSQPGTLSREEPTTGENEKGIF